MAQRTTDPQLKKNLATIEMLESMTDFLTGKTTGQIASAMAQHKNAAAAAEALGLPWTQAAYLTTVTKRHIWQQTLMGGDLEKMAVTYGIDVEEMRAYKRNADQFVNT